MVERNVTTMVIKVDLQCHKCYKKIKKVLCKFPQIRDQAYDEKKNTVTIKVVCCSPEQIKQKICCKGGESVKGIEIILPKPPPPPPIDKATQTDKQKDQTHKKTQFIDIEKPKENPKTSEQAPSHQPPVPEKASPIGVCCTECSEGQGGGPCYHGYGFPPLPPAEKPIETAKPNEISKKIEPDPSHLPLVPVATSPIGVCCTECSEGRGGGPCYRRYAEKPTETPKPKETPKKTDPAPCYLPLIPVAAIPIGVCCTECSEGRGGGPCYRGYGFWPSPPARVCCTECSEGRDGGPCHRGYGFRPPPPPAKKPTEIAKPNETPKKTQPAPCYPPLATSPIGDCCTECSQGRGGGPCYHRYGYPPPQFCDEGYCGRPVYDSWGSGYRDGYYVCEENASACSIM